ncbi:MAG TPA: hypothetical protein VLU25_12885 [Acidobacteriota bacterium]|nr:hypothetical protein [Acidobacteriota bacterium]
MRSLLAKLGLVLSALLLVLLVLEVAVRWADPVINRDPWWKYDPLLGWRADPENGHFDGVSPSGFRHRDFPRRKPAGVKRLVILGDSFSLGVAVKASQTFAARLEEQLDQADPGIDWQVLNLAVNDWGTAQQLIALRDIGLGYQPDAVVLQTFPLNDMCNNCPIMAFTCSFQDAHRPYLRLEKGKWLETRIDWWAPLRASRLFLWAESVLDKRGVDEAAGDEHEKRGRRLQLNAEAAGLEWEGGVSALLPDEHQQPQVKECWQNTHDLVGGIRALLQPDGIPLIGFVVPFSGTFEEKWPDMLERFPAPMQRTYASDRMEEILGQWGLPVISGRQRILQSDQPLSSFFVSEEDGHFSVFGHAQAALWIEEALRDQGLIPSGRSAPAASPQR